MAEKMQQFNNSTTVKTLFHQTFPGRPVPTPKTIHYQVHKLHNKYSLHNQQKGSSKRVVTPENVERVRQIALRETTLPVGVARSSARRNPLGMAPASWSRARKAANLFGYICRRRHRLKEEDRPRRLAMCHFLAGQQPEYFRKLVMTDEARFCLDGTVNLRNHFDWCPKGSGGNPHFYESKSVGSPSIMIWAGLIGDGTKLPLQVFRGGTLTGQKYYRMLQQRILPRLRTHPDFHTMTFQQDGSTVHTTDVAMDYLSNQFGERVLSLRADGIRRDGAPRRGREWSPRSPDLTVMDFWCFAHMKNKVFAHPKPQNLDELEARIRDVFNDLPAETIRAAFQNVRDRAQKCVSAAGGHFEF